MDAEAQNGRPGEADTIADLESDPGDTKKLSTVGRYVILDSIGMGGMGLVCAAYDPKLSRKIALKLLRNASNDEASTAGRNRLFREAQALAKLSHPNVVTVHDVDVFEGQVYIAMEFVEGTTLREWMRDEPRTWKEIRQKFILAGRGIAAAHQADIIHRDFKPSNVLISTEGDVRVADFGVAKERDRSHRDPDRDFAEFERRRRTVGVGGSTLDSSAEEALIDEIQSNVSMDLTVAGRMVGTPAYMAPEQHMGLRVGPHTDQYSFCVSFYEALYGQLPFQGSDRREQLTKMTEGRLPPPPKEGPAHHVPSWLHKVLARGLRPHPSERWPSMEALLAALARDPAKRIRRWAIGTIGVVGVAAGIALGVVGSEEQNPCLALASEVERHWNAERRSAIEAAFAKSDKPFAEHAAHGVTQILDRWAEDWSASKVAVCEATQVGGQSGALLDVRMYCLAQRGREFGAIVNVFAEADDEIIERSIAAADALSDPHSCTSVRDTGEFKDRNLASVALEQVEAMEADLDRAHAFASVWKFEKSLPIQAQVLARAREVSHPWTLARALQDLSKSQLEVGDVVEGEANLREFIHLAAALGDVKQEARAWNRLIFYLGGEHNRIAEGHAWLLAAETALVRAGNDPHVRISFVSTRARLALAEGDMEAAIADYAESVALARAEYGVADSMTIRVMTNHAIALAESEQYAEAERVLLEVVAVSKQVYGSTHPLLATGYVNLGNVYILSEQWRKAEPPLEAALAIRERIGGSDAPNIGKPLHALGKVARNQKRLSEALAKFERVTKIFVKSHGENSAVVAASVTDTGVVQHQLGRYDEARESFDRAQAIYNHIYPQGHRYVGGLMRFRCAMFVDAGEYADAVAACDLALEIAERFELSSETKRENYQLLVAAERGRGRLAAAERAQAEVDRLTAEIEAEANPKSDPKPGKATASG